MNISRPSPSRPSRRTALGLAAGAAATALLAACGGGGGDAGNGSTGVLRFALTDSPACGFDNAWVTVERVRVHRSATAPDNAAGWVEIPVTRQRVDLLTLTNGNMVLLGQSEVDAGSYSQLRLVLAENTPAEPLANAVKPTGGAVQALTTPSGQQSGLKLNANLDVPPGQTAYFAIDFDACKSFVRAGNSGQILLKPVLSVLPVLSSNGQLVEGWLDPALVAAGATVSVQAAGRPVRATPPLPDGKFVLYPVPAGTYDLVVTAPGRVNAAITGVPVTNGAFTTIGSTTARILPPASPASQAAGGTVTVSGSVVDTGGTVRALQVFAGGPTIEVASANATAALGRWDLTLPTGAPVKLPYAAGLTTFAFTPDAGAAGKYTLEATAPAFPAITRVTEITLGAVPNVSNFVFP